MRVSERMPAAIGGTLFVIVMTTSIRAFASGHLPGAPLIFVALHLKLWPLVLARGACHPLRPTQRSEIRRGGCLISSRYDRRTPFHRGLVTMVHGRSSLWPIHCRCPRGSARRPSPRSCDRWSH